MIVVLPLAAMAARNCYGHGFPIHVDVISERLVVSGGLPFDNGFAAMAFDYHEDAFLDTAPGFTVGSTLPGFEINGMEPDSQLWLEVVPRPDFSSPGTPPRWLWHWSETGGEIATAPNDPTMELASQRLFGSVLLSQFAAPTTGPSVMVAEPLATDLGVHEHPILYLLDNAPAAPAGVYGFFTRLWSPNYLPSETVLVALNHTDPANFAQGAKLINAAARLPGDFDGDDDVDGGDLLAWQRTVGSTTELAADASLDDTVNAADLAIWAENYGRVAETTVAAATGVPEPAAMDLTSIAAAAIIGLLRQALWPRSILAASQATRLNDA
jgi:hypothetical protein